MSRRQFVDVGGRRAAFVTSASTLSGDAARLVASFSGGALADPRMRDDAARSIDEMRAMQRDLERHIADLQGAIVRAGEQAG
ncbi:MAG: hypothetical protein JST00_31665 [Deltaproteobacteria bacterium]|nr:hypothetical protein [Deltaproteobacteria bacterium]